MLLPYVIAFNCSHSPEVAKKYAHLSAKLGFVSYESSEENKLGAFLEAIIKLQRTLGCPMTLTDFGIDKATSEVKLDLMADRALEDMCYQFNPYPANRNDLIELYRNVL